MRQSKFSLTESHVEFLEQHRAFGFADKSAVVRRALDQLRAWFAEERLRESAELYAEVYGQDGELQRLTENALEDWPE